MKKLSILIALAFFAINSNAQVTVDNTSMTVQQYIQNVLGGSGVVISNVQFNGGSAAVVNEQVGSFNDVNSDVGLGAGVILGSGDVQLAAQLNTSGSSGLGGTGLTGVDPDLAAITPNQVYDECIVEFDFIPAGDTISFKYVFASEEYDEYVCGSVNDAFGFFLSGANPAGGMYSAFNIALIPDPLNPGTFTTTPVSINTVNLGVAGSNGTLSNCTSIDPNFASYNIFYTQNSVNTYEYDGRTVVLEARAAVNCGEVYHIKLAIGDAGDAVYDSGVFLEAGSLTSSGIAMSVVTPFPNNTIIEGCGDAIVTITRSDTLTNDTIYLNLSGNANPSEYSVIDPMQIFGNGNTTITFNIAAFIDNVAEGTDTILIELAGNIGCNMLTIYIEDYIEMQSTVSDSVNICTELGESAQIWTNVTGGNAPFVYSWSDAGGTLDTVVVAPGLTTYYTATISDACGNSITTDEVPVWVQCPIAPPNVFTPNGDGMNDFFFVINLEDYISPSLKIFNRWGKIVYESDNYKNDWNGGDVSDGTYYYIVTPNNTKYEYDAGGKDEIKFTVKGFVQIFR